MEREGQFNPLEEMLQDEENHKSADQHADTETVTKNEQVKNLELPLSERIIIAKKQRSN